MTGRLDLEDFGAAIPAARSAPLVAEPDPAALAEARVTGYEEGYKTGWDDAAAAAQAEKSAIREELAATLKDLDFSYFEARSEVLGAAAAFLDALLEQVFGGLLGEAAAAAIRRELMSALENCTAGDIVLRVSPDDADLIRSLLAGTEGAAARLREDPALAAGQARVTGPDGAVEIDAAGLISRLSEAVRLPRELKEVANG